MKISFSLSGFTKGVEREYIGELIGKEVWIGWNHNRVGYITDVDPISDLVYAEISDDVYNELFVEAKHFNKCSFEIKK